MRVFITGASGHMGSAVIRELTQAGHEVVGLARSDNSAAMLTAAGAEVLRGDLDDLDNLRRDAAEADGVIHLAFKSSGSTDPTEAITTDLRAIEAIAAALEGSGKPIVTIAGTLMLSFVGQITDRPATEQDVMPGGPRIDAENAVIALAERGVRSSVVRLPPIVHSTFDHHGFARTLIAIARGEGVSGYVGADRWPSVHTLDAARVYRLALETAPAGTRLQAVAEEGVPFCHIAEVISRKLGMPTASITTQDPGQHFGFLGPFVALDNATSSTITQDLLGWTPTDPGLIADLEQVHYFEQTHPAAA